MLVLIDESGDAGFKLDRGSSPLFVVAMVIFRDLGQAERAGDAIAEALVRLRAKPEFKFSKCRNELRDSFFQVACELDFRVRAVVVDKSLVHSGHLRAKPEAFYNYFIQQLLKNDGGALLGARVKLDGSGDREFRRSLTSYLRQRLPTGQISKLTFADSKSDSLVQLADMCAGAIAKAYCAPELRTARWYEWLRNARRIEDLWQFR